MCNGAMGFSVVCLGWGCGGGVCSLLYFISVHFAFGCPALHLSVGPPKGNNKV